MTKPLSKASITARLLLPLFLIASAPASAEVWVVPAVAPWNSTASDPAGPGIIDDWLVEVAKRTKLEMPVRGQPYARVRQGIQDGTIDASVVIQSKTAETYSEFPACFIKQPTVIIAKKGVKLASPEDLYALKRGVGYIRGASFGKEFDEDTKILKSEEIDFDSIFKKIIADRLDAAISSSVGILYYAKLNNYSDALGDRLSISSVQVCVQVPKGKANTDFMKAVTQAVDAMRADGSAAAIVSKYVGPNWQ